MKAVFRCTRCGKETDVHTHKSHCDCGGLWELAYELPAFDEALIDRDEWSIFRYRAFMPLQTEDWRSISLGEGMTPVIRYSDDLLLKMDYMMPTLSFKDRGAAVLIAHARSIGVSDVVQDSSGNAGNSVAAYCARAHIGCDIYVPEGTSPAKINMIKAHGAGVHEVSGSRDHCADVCREAAARPGVYYANHVYNPFFYEGTKTYIYEVFEQLHRIPRHIFVPLGNGTLFIGVVLGLEHLLASGLIEQMPQIVAMQSERCAPFARAQQQGMDTVEPVVGTPTLAEGIAIGEPMRAAQIMEMIQKYAIEVIEIPEENILAARAELAGAGIYCEHTTAAGYAGYRHYCHLHGGAKDSLLTMCGAGLKSDH